MGLIEPATSWHRASIIPMHIAPSADLKNRQFMQLRPRFQPTIR